MKDASTQSLGGLCGPTCGQESSPQTRGSTCGQESSPQALWINLRPGELPLCSCIGSASLRAQRFVCGGRVVYGSVVRYMTEFVIE